MDTTQAKKVIQEAINQAFLAGCYSLGEAEAIILALTKVNSLIDLDSNEFVNPTK